MNATGQHGKMNRIRRKKKKNKESIQRGSPRGRVPKVSEKISVRRLCLEEATKSVPENAVSDQPRRERHTYSVESIELIELELAISIDAISGKSRVRVAQ